MNRSRAAFALLGMIWPISLAAQNLTGALEGTVKKIDAGAKTVVVDTTDGTEHTFHYASDVTVHGAQRAEAGISSASRGTVHDLQDGGRVAVHYTEAGGKDTAHEFDKLGKDGLQRADGTVTAIDRAGKTISIRTADGARETFHMTDMAAKDTGRDLDQATNKTAKVSVYYTEVAGVKTAHFFERAF